MTPDKLWEVLERYDRELAAGDVPVRRFDQAEYGLRGEMPRAVFLAHCRWMCRRCLDVFRPEYARLLESVPPPDRYGIVPADDVLTAREPLEKAMRWLGYVQGVCNARGVYSCSELREHSRTDDQKGPL